MSTDLNNISNLETEHIQLEIEIAKLILKFERENLGTFVTDLQVFHGKQGRQLTVKLN